MEVAQSWQKVLGRAIRDIPALLERLGLHLNDFPELNLNPKLPILVPESWLERIEPNNAQDPLLLQVLSQRIATQDGFIPDPLEEKSFSLAPGLLQKYKHRALLTLTEACPIHCQYCFRQNFSYQDNRLGQKSIEATLKVIQDDADIEEIILSGGDPLSLPNKALKPWLESLSALKQIKRIRFHTRFPIIIPSRIDNHFCELLKNLPQKVVIVVHSNHPNEINNAVQKALLKLKDAHVTLLNQSVLLKNINDQAEVLAALSKKLFDAGVLPYYLHLLDKVSGTEYFNAEADLAKAIFAELKGLLPGYLVPRLVQEVPHDVSKRWI